MITLNWSDLPKELWPIIGRFLHSRVDVTRFRSVCSLWHSSRPPFQPPQPPPPPLPLKFSPGAGAAHQALLYQSSTYLVESLVHNDRCCSSKPWLVKLEEDPNSGQMRSLHTVTGSPIRYLTGLNLLDFRLVELRKSYVVKFSENKFVVKSVHKVVVLPCDDDLCFGDGFVVFMLYNEGKLGFWRSGDEKLTRVDEKNTHYDDLLVYKDQCYLVDRWGTISWISSDLQVIQFSPLLCVFGGQKHLVECNDDLYVVDQYFEDITHQGRGKLRYHGRDADNEIVRVHSRKSGSYAEAVDFKVYRLDQEWGKWVDVKNLGEQAFILSNDVSFSVSAREFAGMKGNCIFFVQPGEATGIGRADRAYSRMFSLEDGKIRNSVNSASLCLIVQFPDGPSSFNLAQP